MAEICTKNSKREEVGLISITHPKMIKVMKMKEKQICTINFKLEGLLNCDLSRIKQ